ncbi:MAG TPA: hypothetical protein PKD91_02005 [Bacteroidia bacterium]|nr:hypothetical protein [Bacteroidia bacterium]
MIPLRNALDIMDTGEPFHVTVVTCDLERNTGGKIIKFEPVVLNQQRRSKPGTGTKSKKPKIRKHRNNWEHNTRTIRILASAQIRTIHVQLITEFNGEKVI